MNINIVKFANTFLICTSMNNREKENLKLKMLKHYILGLKICPFWFLTWTKEKENWEQTKEHILLQVKPLKSEIQNLVLPISG